MSLRTLRGVRIRSSIGRHGGLAGVEYGWVSVEDVQRMLAVFAQQHPGSPSPGQIDGVWGRRTEAAWGAWVNSATYEGSTDILEMDPDKTVIRVVDALKRYVESQAVVYRPGMENEASAVDPGPGVEPYEGGGGLVLEDPLPGPPPVVYQPHRFRMPWWGWVLLVLGAMGAGYGVYRWYLKSRR